MTRYLTELIGTFFLVFAIGTTAVAELSHAPIVVGCTLTVLVYLGGRISGAHYNPAVSIAIFLRGSLEKSCLLPYIGVQLLGAWLAATAVFMISGSTFALAPNTDYGLLTTFLSEALVTFVLVLVILNVAPSPATQGNSYYGVAIGFTVLAGMYAVGPISGGAFNPAVGFGPIVVDTFAGRGSFENLWYYILGPLAGSLLALPIFRMQLSAEPD